MQNRIFLPAYLPALLFPFAALFAGLRNPAIFDAPALVGESPLPLILIVILSGLGIVPACRSGNAGRIVPGLIISLSFLVGYFLLASLFNRPEINTNNVFFAADNSSWYQRMAAREGWEVGTRAVHPLAHMIFRPLTAGLSLITSGDRLHANLILIALAGGMCVFLMWKILYSLTGDGTHALLFASLFGLAGSQLVFASMIETYIFSTLCLLLFLWLALENKPSRFLILAGIATLGITITNLVQELLIHLFLQKNPGRTVVIFSLVLLFGAGLNFLSHAVYPGTGYFFLPDNLMEEGRFSQKVDLDRAGLMIENLLVYNVTPPQPYTGMRNGMPRFNFLTGTIREFAPFGWPAFILWMFIMTKAAVRFVRNLRLKAAGNALSITMLACMAFNFILHIGYGSEPFLYSPDWTYALILFTAINLQDPIHKSWGKAALTALVMAVFVNNLWFVYLIAARVRDHLI